jgi:hypothetical protein
MQPVTSTESYNYSEKDKSQTAVLYLNVNPQEASPFFFTRFISFQQQNVKSR